MEKTPLNTDQSNRALSAQQYPLHLAQQEVYFDQVTDSKNPGYNVGGYVILRGPLDRSCFENAIQSLPEVFDIFRCTFSTEGTTPTCQFSTISDPILLLEQDFSKQPKPKEAATNWIQEQFNIPFELSSGQLYEFALLKITEDESWWYLRYHHLLTDGFGISIINKYVAQKYASLVGPDSTVQKWDFPGYEDAVKQSGNYLDSDAYLADATYWQEKFSKIPEPLFKRRHFKTISEGEQEDGRITIELPSALLHQLRATALQTKTSLQQLILAASCIYWGQTEQQQEMVLGLPIHKRTDRRQRQTAGTFSGLIPFLATYQPEISVAELIQAIKKQQRQDYRHLSYPISHLNRELKLMAQGQEQLFDAVMIYDYVNMDLDFGTVESESRQISTTRNNTLPLSMRWCDYGTQQPFLINIDFQKAYFQKQEIELLIERIFLILSQFTGALDQPLNQIKILPEEEKEVILGLRPNEGGIYFNKGEKDLGVQDPIQVVFEKQLSSFRKCPAIIHGDETWSYEKLNHQANRIAHLLKVMDVQAGDFVGVYQERSPELIASLLGIMKCGAIYVPLDTQNPVERIEKMIVSADTKCIISTTKWIENIRLNSHHGVLLTNECTPQLWSALETQCKHVKDSQDLKRCSTQNPKNLNSVQDAAYMLYTSGSTGAPKGAISKHDGALNHMYAEYEALNLAKGFRFLQSAGIGSDISVWQMLGPLLRGGAVVIIDKYDLLDYDKVIEIIKDQRVNLVEFVPTYTWGLIKHLGTMQEAAPSFSDLQWLMLSGEEAPVKLVNEWLSLFPDIKVLNAYGPCEASDDVVQCVIDQTIEETQLRVSIGRPIANMNVLVLDANMQICPIGVAGELCVSGIGVGLGYKGLPEKTAAAFVPNPYSEVLGDTIYRTGDLARWLPDGRLDFLGRIDTQVKVRGHRVELGEIENIIRQEANVKDAHVLVHTDANQREALVAFMVRDEEGQRMGSGALTEQIKEDQVAIATGADQDKLLVEYNSTTVDFPRDITFVDLFEQQVEQTPDHTVLVFGDRKVSYRQLNEQANQLAHFLRAKGVREETFVSICIDRSIEMIVGILGIVKAGGVYVPIDPEYPQDRIDYLIEDVNSPYVVCTEQYVHFFQNNSAVDITHIDREWEQISKSNTENPVTGLSATNLMYVNYTSGSTGNPKGVCIEHRSLVNMALCWKDEYQINEQSSLLQVSGFSFDVFAGDLCRGLLFGGKMVMFPQNALNSFSELYNLIKREKVNIMEVVPTFGISLMDYIFDQQLDYSWMKILIMGSDICSVEGYKRVVDRFGKQIRILNSYGTTETTIDSCYFEVTDTQKLSETAAIPVGKPLYNTYFYLLNDDLELVAPGAEGEIYIGGAGMARSYLNRPKLTRQKFIANPFRPGETMYKTGDLGRWTVDGNLQCLGRIDDQIKIDGHRIELGEIETVLQQDSHILQSKVLAKTFNNGKKKLVAFYVCQQAVEKHQIRKTLSDRLPKYMIPEILMEVEEMPLTPNGKIDKKALLNFDSADKLKRAVQIRCQQALPSYMQPTHYQVIDEMPLNLSDKVDEPALIKLFTESGDQLYDISNNYTPPRNEMEATLADIWKELLHVSRVSIYDNFFELGGDSITTIQAVSKAKRAGYQLKPQHIFQKQTIAGLSEVLNQQMDQVVTEQGQLSGAVPLSPIQMAFFEEEPAGLNHYNQTLLLELSKEVSLDQIQSAADALVSQHDALRLTFSKSDNHWHQEFGTNQIVVTTIDLSLYKTDALAQKIAEICEEQQKNLDIQEGRLVNIVLLQTPDNESNNRLLLAVHHLVIDGVSWRILLDDFSSALTDLKKGEVIQFGKKTSSYRAWVSALQQYATTAKVSSEEKYWAALAKEYQPLPTDKIAPIAYRKEVQTVEISLDEARTTALLQQANQAYRTKINDLLLGALTDTITNWSGNSKVIIGLEGHGRDEFSSNVDLSSTIGWFTSIYPVALEKGANLSTGALIQSIKEQLRKTPQNGFNYQLLRYLQPSSDVHPALAKIRWDITFNYLGQFDNVLQKSPWFYEAGEAVGPMIAGDSRFTDKFEINCLINKGQLKVNWLYSDQQYASETVEQLAANYLKNLEQLIDHCLSCQEVSWTPSDFGLNQIVENEELQKFLLQKINGRSIKEQISDLYRLSSMQEGLLFHHLYNPDSGAYTGQFTFDVKGAIDIEGMRFAWNEILNKHTALRTAFFAEDLAIPVQCVFSKVQMPLEVIDLSAHSISEQNQKIEAFLDKDRNLGFDFHQPPLMRITLFELNKTSGQELTRMLLTSHHILMDGWSMPPVLEDLLQAYESYANGNRTSILQKDQDTYRDYIQYLDRQDSQAERAFWENYLSNVEGPSLLPFIGNTIERNKANTAKAERSLEFEAARTTRIKEFIKRSHITLNTLIQGVWAIVLGKYTEQKQPVFGVVVSGRPTDQEDAEEKVGLFINTIPFTASLTDGQLLSNWMASIQEEHIAAREYQFTSLNDIQDWKKTTGDLFDTIVIYEDYPMEELMDKNWALNLGDITVKDYDNYLLSINVLAGETLSFRFSYNDNLITGDYIEMITNHFDEVFRQIINAEPAQTELSEISLLSNHEKAIILGQKPNRFGNWFNPQERDLGNKETIDARFERVAKENPTFPAIIHGTEQWTYQQLQDHSNQIGHCLQHFCLPPQGFVGIYLDRSPVLISALMGTLKAGGVYVPLDTQNPEERIGKMVKDGGIDTLITSSKRLQKLDLPTVKRVILVDDCPAELKSKIQLKDIELKDKQDINFASTGTVENANDLRNWAYMLYTSGSTGQPKGAITRHDGAMNHILAEYEAMQLADGFRFLQSASIGSDISVWQILAPLLKGGASVIIDKFELLDYQQLVKTLIKDEIDLVEFVPSYIWGLVDYLKGLSSIPALPHLKWMMFCGEALPVKLVNEWLQLYPQTRVLNAYGPCEASDDITQYEISSPLDPDQLRVPIGRPLANLNLFVIDSNDALCPIGVPGELCVSGIGVGAGYYGMPEKTKAAFIKNPFSGTLGDTLYKTGDLGRWLPDGNLEFLGRIDRQVKIRGNRIELGEVESFLREHPLVKEAHIVVQKIEEKQEQLTGFIVFDEHCNTEKRLIGKALQQSLTSRLEQYNEEVPQVANQVLSLENGLKLYQLNKPEALFAFNEIFTENAYLQHGVNLEPGAVIFDVGANIGMFSMFVGLHFPGSKVFAFEPLPPTYEVLRANCHLYGLEATLVAYNAGLSNECQQVQFTHYPKNSMLSGRYSDQEADQVYVRKVLENQLSGEGDFSAAQLEELVTTSMEKEVYDCELLTVSEVIKREGLNKIDLLKVDVERSELDVLAGIDNEDWPKIQQIVVEVHDDGHSLQTVQQLLTEKGFSYHIEKEDLLQGTDLVNIYATRTGNKKRLAASPSLLTLEESIQQLQQYCQEGLPGYMQPAEYLALAEMPVNLSDKIDEKQLLSLYQQEKVLPRESVQQVRDNSKLTSTERSVVQIWEQVLDLDNIGLEANFFEIGGHSLLAMRVKSAIRKELEVEVDIRDLFNLVTVAELAKFIDSKNKGTLLPTLTPQEKPAQIPLSYAQERLWFIDKLSGSVNYHTRAVFSLKGDLDKEVLGAALAEIVNRHEALRTIYKDEDGKAYQVVLPAGEWELKCVQFSEKEAIDQLIEAELYTPFDLSADHMLRVTLIEKDSADYLMVLVMHHIASDGWSLPIFGRELMHLYNCKLAGKPFDLAPLAIQYTDFAIWQRMHLTGDILSQKLNYWEEKLSGVAPLDLPTDFARPAVQSSKGKIVNYELDHQYLEQLQALAKENEATLFMVLLAIFKVMLHRYTRQETICVGTPTANRSQREVESLIGFFINTLALRSDIHDKQRFSDFLAQVKQTTLEAYAHQDVPFEKIVDRVEKTRDMSISPLFQVMFILQNNKDIPVLQLNEVPMVEEDYEMETSQFDLTFELTETDQGINLDIEYCTDLFKQSTIDLLMDHYRELIASVCQNPEQLIGGLNMVPAIEREVILGLQPTASGIWFNQPEKELGNTDPINVIFEKTAGQNEQLPAIIHHSEVWTYKQVNTWSNQISHCLQALQIQPGDFVGIYLDRSPDLICSLIAILKGGGVYVPLDTQNPEDRIAKMIDHGGFKALITTTQLAANLDNIAVSTLLFIDECDDKTRLDYELKGFRVGGRADIDQSSSFNPPNQNELTSWAYMLYTSGSTGQPKGAITRHDGAMNHILAEYEAMELSEDFRFLQSAGIGSDISVWQMLAPILMGGSVVIIDKLDLLDYEYLLDLLERERVTLVEFVPSFIRGMIEHIKGRDQVTPLTHLQWIMLSGEAAPVELVNEWKTNYPQVRILNGYGPCEASDDITQYEVTEVLEKNQLRVPIGRPIANMNIVVLDELGQLCPIGVLGEVCVTGIGVGAGYHGLPDKTAESFVPNPFENLLGETMYRTGDWGRWLPDGNLEFFGRIDGQVKIRGHRIELGEIEAIITEIPQVKNGHVLVYDHNATKQSLVAFIVPNPEYLNAGFSQSAIEEYLEITLSERCRKALPAYMQPTHYCFLESLPRNLSDKVDRRKLTEYFTENYAEKVTLEDNYVAPRNEEEACLAEIWQQLLNVEQVGVHHNFFDLGGDSIIIIQVVSRAKRAGYQLSPRDLFQFQTIAKLAAKIQKSTSELMAEQGRLTGLSGLSPIQQFYFENEHIEANHYNQSILLKIDKSTSIAHLEKAISTLIDQHDALRFTYEHLDQGWQQTYDDINYPLIVEDFTSMAVQDLAKSISQQCQQHQEQVDPTKGRTASFVLLQMPATESKNRLFIAVNHLAIDGISWRILIEHLTLILEALRKEEEIHLGSKGSAYRDWVNALIKYANLPKVERQLPYWQEIIKDESPLPIDKPGSQPARMNRVRELTLSLDANQTRQLIKEVNQSYNTEIDDLLIAALAKTINEWSGNDQLVIGLEGHGREDLFSHLDISSTIGWFTNLYPVLVKTPAHQSISDLIRSTKENLRRIPEKGMGYGLLRYLNTDDSTRAALAKGRWEVVFNYLGQFDNVFESESILSEASEETGTDIGNNGLFLPKLEVEGAINNGQLTLTWSYADTLYEEQTVEKLAHTYFNNLGAIIQHCLDQEDTIKTPADFGLEQVISYPALDQFLNKSEPQGLRKDLIDAIYPLSPIQEGILFHGLYTQASDAYIEQYAFDLAKNTDLEALEAAWNLAIENHSILRSAVFYEQLPISVQCVYKNAVIPFEVIDFSDLTERQFEEAYQKFLEEDFKQKFDFNCPPLMRVNIVKMADGRYRMVWTCHHLLMDGWSLPILMEEILESYEAYLDGNTTLSDLEQPVDQYEDYIRFLQSRDEYADEIFWKNYLQGLENGSLLPFVGNTLERNKGGASTKEVTVVFDKKYSDELGNFARENRITINTIVQGVWSFVLAKYTGANNVVFGVTASGRPPQISDSEDRIGLYINTLPIHANLLADEAIIDWLKELQETHTNAREYQYNSLKQIQNWSQVQGELFDSILVFENYPMGEVLSQGWKLEMENLQVQAQTNYLLSIIVSQDQQLSIRFLYDDTLLDQAKVDLISGHFQQVLKQFITATSLKEVELLTPGEKEQLLLTFNQTSTPYPTGETAVSLFEKQVSADPDRKAVVLNEEVLTYQQLDERANQLARYLNDQGVGRESIVALCLGRSLDTIVSILAVLKAGGAYLPIDPGYPQDRIHYLLDDAKVNYVVTNQDLGQRFAERPKVQTILLDQDRNRIEALPTQSPQNIIRPNQLMYVIYTSGSTGRPKGVMIEHTSNVNMALDQIQRFGVTENDHVLQFASLSFDASVYEIFMALYSGAALVLIDKPTTQEGEAFVKYIAKQEVSIVTLPPAFLSVLDLDQLKFLRVIITAGEAANVNHATYCAGFTTYYNAYGPTECAVCVSTYKVNQSDDQKVQIPIGTPLSNTNILILDKEDQLVPTFVEGEICISGVGLARGYLYREELTAQKFVAHPFIAGERLYKTGDRGRWLPDGNVEFLGRIDNQVKVRGYRIELDEIEAVLQQFEKVNQSAVIVHQEASSKRIVAYIVPEGDFDKEAIIQYLQAQLPEYMIPAVLVELDKLPLNTNGKVDKKALPSPDTSMDSERAITAPTNKIEEDLLAIWQELLQVQNIGIHDNFFELGGDSIVSIQVVGRAKRFGYLFSPKDLFTHATISTLANKIEQQQVVVEAEQGALSGEVALLPIQSWFFENDFQEWSHFNQAILLKANKDLDKEHLQSAIDKLMFQHDGLRMKYRKASKGKWVQEYGETTAVLETIDLRGIESGKLNTRIEEICEQTHLSLQLEQGEMIRFVLIQTPTENNADRLFICAHHLVIDEVSWRILLDQLTDILNALSEGKTYEPGKKTSSFRQWSNRLQQYSTSEHIVAQKEFWRQVVGKASSLPVDYTGVKGVTAGEQSYLVQLNKATTESLLQKSNFAYQTSTEELLLCALTITIQEWSNINDLLIGLEGHGREELFAELDTSSTIGWFTNLYPVSLAAESVLPLGDQIKSIKEKLRAIPDKGLGYGLLRYLHPAQEVRNSLQVDQFDLIFNYSGQTTNGIGDNPWFSMATEASGTGVSDSFPLSGKLVVNAEVNNGQLTVSWSFSNQQYQDTTIENLAKSFTTNLTKIIDHCKSKKSREFTPSDLGMNGEVSYKELESFNDFLEDQEVQGEDILKF